MKTVRCFSALQRAENSSIGYRMVAAGKPPASFSALQRAENSSISYSATAACAMSRFQCSSASRKFLNHPQAIAVARATYMFQCSSASRKFLNHKATHPDAVDFQSFSALQRAENSSIPKRRELPQRRRLVSVLFSEPKIPQSRPSHLRPSIFPTAMITLRHS